MVKPKKKVREQVKKPPRRSTSSLDDELDSDDSETSLLPLDSIVKVFTSHSDPNFCLPWQKHQQARSSGTGFVISGRPGKDERFVLTNAHCVEHHNQVQVKKRGDDTKFIAHVISIGWACDLALLKVKDEEFYTGLIPVEFCRRLPNLEDEVLCVGYPVGGDTLSITSGVVSRVEVVDYAQNHTDLLGVQIDAAINSGNSGGPAFNKKSLMCVGVAFQGLCEAENIGYIIPVIVVDHFLQDLMRTGGNPKGFPTIGVEIQLLENPSLRKACKLDDKDKSHKGVLIKSVGKTSAAYGVLKEGDVLCAFNDVSIGNDGTTTLRKGERVAFSWNISKLFHGDIAPVRILRDGVMMNLDVTLTQPFQLCPSNLPDGQPMPTYFIVGGLVWTPLIQPYLSDAYGEDWQTHCSVELSYRVQRGTAEDRETQMITLAQVLAHDATIGYEELEGSLLEKINGEKIKNMSHLIKRVADLRNSDTQFLRIETVDKSLIVLEIATLEETDSQILVDQSIPSLLSVDLLPKSESKAKNLTESEKTVSTGAEDLPSFGSDGSFPEKLLNKPTIDPLRPSGRLDAPATAMEALHEVVE